MVYFLLTCPQLNTSIPLLRREAGKTEGYHHTICTREQGKEQKKRTSVLPCLPTTKPPCMCSSASSSAFSFKKKKGRNRAAHFLPPAWYIFFLIFLLLFVCLFVCLLFSWTLDGQLLLLLFFWVRSLKFSLVKIKNQWLFLNFLKSFDLSVAVFLMYANLCGQKWCSWIHVTLTHLFQQEKETDFLTI